MTEISCRNCNAACCQGPLVVSLTLEEASFMLRGGNKLVTVAQPADHDREDVIYPLGQQMTEGDPGSGRFLVERDNPTEPLAAGLGRYILLGTCAYLRTDGQGWEYCSVYDDRPAVCRDFQMGEAKCQLLRIVRGVDGAVGEAL